MAVYRQRHNKVPFPTISQIEKSLNLQINEVAALWTPIYDVIHKGHWDPTQFHQYSREHYDFLRYSSHKIIRDMIENLTTGGSFATMNISIDSRMRTLIACSLKKINNLSWPSLNPELPPDSAIQTWSSRPDMYPQANSSGGLICLLERLGGDLPVYGSSVQPNTIDVDSIITSVRGQASNTGPNPILADTTRLEVTRLESAGLESTRSDGSCSDSFAPQAVTSTTPTAECLSDDDDLYSAPRDTIVKHVKLLGNEARVPDPKLTTPRVRAHPESSSTAPKTPPPDGRATRIPASQSSAKPHGETSPSPKNTVTTYKSTPTGCQAICTSESETEKDKINSGSEDEDEFDPVTLLDNDANPGLSTFLQIGGEHVNVTNKMLSRIEQMVNAEWEADCQVIAGVVESHNSWEEITRCGLILGRLSFTGAANYVIQGLSAEYNQAAEIVRHFGKKMDKCEDMIEEVRRARIRAEQNRYILDGISAKSDTVTLKAAKEKHKQVMEEFGPGMSLTTSPGQKRKSRDYTHRRKTLKKVRRSGGGSSSSS